MDKPGINIILLVGNVNCAFASVLETAVLISGTISSSGFSVGSGGMREACPSEP